MAFMDHRLRMLLSQCEEACSTGRLTRAMLDGAVCETMAYKEPTASDIRLLLGGLSPEKTPSLEILSRLKQAQYLLNSSANYE